MVGRPDGTYRIAGFELDGKAFALRRAGQLVKIENRPLELLMLLAERRGQLVTREDIAARLWGADFHVEIDMGVNTAVLKVRRVLGEHAAVIETVPGKGYRLANEGENAAPAHDAGKTATPAVIAVLPFDNLSGSPEHDYIADGFTEETIALLGEVDPVRITVIGRRSVLAYRGSASPIAEIGATLAADYLVESSIRIEGARIRITSRLVRVDGQAQIWSRSFNGDFANMLDLQQSLASTIAEQVSLRLLVPAQHSRLLRQTSDARAYDLYLRGRALWNRGTAPAIRQAIGHYTQATELDPTYGLAWSGLADAYAGGPIMSDAPPRAIWTPARDAAAKAVQFAPGLAEALASYGFVQFWLDWNWPAAETEFRASVECNPSFAFAHRMVGIAASHQGQHEEARHAIRRARELDPLYAMHHALSAQIEINARGYEAALRFSRHATVIDPEFWIGHFQLGQAYAHLGDFENAFRSLNTAGELAGGNSKTISLQGYVLARSGRVHEARERVETLLAVSRERYVPPYAIALVHAGLGEDDDALDWLERAHDAHDVHLAFLPVDSKWDALRDTLRFRKIVQGCGFSTIESVSQDQPDATSPERR